MIGIALFLWSPFVMYNEAGIAGVLGWIFAINCKNDRVAGYYGLKLRVLGLEGTLWTQIHRKKGAKLTFGAENIVDWSRFLMENGVKIAVPMSKIVNLDAKTVTLPVDLGEISLGIGDKMAIGSPDSYQIVQIEGLHEQEEGTCLYHYTLNLR